MFSNKCNGRPEIFFIYKAILFSFFLFFGSSVNIFTHENAEKIFTNEKNILLKIRYELALISFQREDYGKTKNLLEELLSISKEKRQFFELQYYLAECQYLLGDFHDAVRSFQSYLLSSDSGHFKESALFRLGIINQALNQIDESIKYLLILKNKYPFGLYYLDSLRVLGNAYRLNNEPLAANVIFNEIIEISDDLIENQNYFFEIALTNIDFNRSAEAIPYLKQATKGPDSSIREMSLYYLGLLLIDMEEVEEGLVSLFSVIESFPEGDVAKEASLAIVEYFKDNNFSIIFDLEESFQHPNME